MINILQVASQKSRLLPCDVCGAEAAARVFIRVRCGRVGLAGPRFAVGVRSGAFGNPSLS